MAAQRGLEGALWKKEKGKAFGAKWARKLVVVDGTRGTVQYHRPNDAKDGGSAEWMRARGDAVGWNAMFEKRRVQRCKFRRNWETSTKSI